MCLIKCFHELSDSELASLIAGQVTCSAKNPPDIHEVNDITYGISSFRDALADSRSSPCKKLAGEKLDGACANWESARRRRGHSMNAWTVYLRKGQVLPESS